jgi:copper resistance protein C
MDESTGRAARLLRRLAPAPRLSTLLRLLTAALVAVVTLLLGASPALAHTRLVNSDPADGASLSAAPEAVSLTFSENVEAEFATVSVVGPDGTNHQTGPLSAADGVVRTAVSPLGPAGRYEIGYRVVSDDGHPVQGVVAFTLTTPGPAAAPSPAAAAPATTQVDPQGGLQQDDRGSAAWLWIVGGVVLVGAGTVAALRLGSRT